MVLPAGVPLLVLVVTAFGFLAYALGFLKEYLIGLAVVPVLLWILFWRRAAAPIPSEEDLSVLEDLSVESEATFDPADFPRFLDSLVRRFTHPPPAEEIGRLLTLVEYARTGREYVAELQIVAAGTPSSLRIRFTKSAPGVLQARFLSSRTVAAWIGEAARVGGP